MERSGIADECCYSQQNYQDVTRSPSRKRANVCVEHQNVALREKIAAFKRQCEVNRKREYRAKQRAINPPLPKKLPKTSAQRQREYRARKKALKQNKFPGNHEQPCDHIDNIIIIKEEQVNRDEFYDESQQQHELGDMIKEEQLNIDDQNDINEQQVNYDEYYTPLQYRYFNRNQKAHEKFHETFNMNPFGYACRVCDRLWFKNDLKVASAAYENILRNIIENFVDVNSVMVCSTCVAALDKGKIPILSVYNGFKYPPIPTHLPPLDLVTERLISPRIPFLQIRQLQHTHGQYSIYGHVINVPVSVNTMVNHLPRDIDDDHCIYVHIKRKKIHKSNFFQSLINKKTVKAWLQYLVDKPLYLMYNVSIDDSFFNNEIPEIYIDVDEMSEDVPTKESVLVTQHTLLWSDERCLGIVSGKNSVLMSLLFDEHAEELAFPSIYLGQVRTFKEELSVTPFQIASSELRRSDRRGVTPQHLLYVVIKILQIRVRDSLKLALKHIGTNTNITKEQVESEEYIHGCIDNNLAFLKSIPNSTYYWSQRKKDLFAIMRQKGKPTAFLTLSANEIGWSDLIKLLYKLKNNGVEILDENFTKLTFADKNTLVNEDAVTCAIYFNKIVSALLNILQSKRFSPFCQYRVLDYFKRIEFQHCGSPQAHILLWLANAPKDIMGADKNAAISLIDQLVSVSANEASGNIDLNTHQHTFTCYEQISSRSNEKCRFEAPFMPSRKTVILTPMDKSEDGFRNYASRYRNIRINLKNNDYSHIDTFYRANNITSDDEYYKIISAGITHPKAFCKRNPSEKWHNQFNPFIFSKLCSNMDFQIILEEHSCAAYVVEYINKTNRGVSNLYQQITDVMNEHPEFDINEMARKIGVDIINNVELTSQEAAWYLLREPLSKSSVSVIYIPTVWPIERQRIRKTQKELEHIDNESTDIWKANWFDKYETRPDFLSEVSLAQFVSNYYKNKRGQYTKRATPCVIRYRNFDISKEINEYKREMVTLHIPFKNENEDILAEMKFIKIYDDNEALISERRKEFDSYLDINKMIEICRLMCKEEEEEGEQELDYLLNKIPDENPFDDLF